MNLTLDYLLIGDVWELIFVSFRMKNEDSVLLSLKNIGKLVRKSLIKKCKASDTIARFTVKNLPLFPS